MASCVGCASAVPSAGFAVSSEVISAGRVFGVRWAADTDPKFLDSVPRDEEVMKVAWGWRNTQAKSLESEKLMEQWTSLDALRAHLSNIFV